MGYSNFRKMRTVAQRFGLNAELKSLFPVNLPEVQPSNWLKETLEMAKFVPLTNEKSKSERLVSPILVEIARQYPSQITLFSGEDLSVEPENDLSGECDFFFALHAPKPFIDAPIISLVEAKDEDMEWGMAQCAAQMYGASLFNEREGKKNLKTIYGCTTTGKEWQFLKLENKTIEVDNSTVTDVSKLLGIWHHIIKFYTS